MMIAVDFDEDLNTTTITEAITTTPTTSDHLFTKLFIYFSCILLLILLCLALVNIRKFGRKTQINPSLPSLPPELPLPEPGPGAASQVAPS